MLNLLKIEHPDLIILDLMLPDLDAWRFVWNKKIKQLLRNSYFDVNSKNGPEDKIKGLEYGADDYVTKPFEVENLLPELKQFLRRSEWENGKNALAITENFIIDFNH